MRLVYEESGDAPVQIGDTVHVSGVPYFVYSITKPHKPSSTGRVICQAMTDRPWFCEWFPSVIGAKWIEREDH